MSTYAQPSVCPHFQICGGCVYAHDAYALSRAEKETHVKELLTPLLAAQEAPFVWEETQTPSPLIPYRNKMEFTFGDEVKGGPLSLGLHKKGRFHDIVSVPDCQIADADFRRILSAVLHFFAPFHEQGMLSYYHRKKQTGYLRHLLVRKGSVTGEILVDLVTTSSFHPSSAGYTLREEELLQHFAKTLLALPLDGTLCGVLHTVNDAKADAVIDGGTTVLSGKSAFTEELLGLSFTITPFSFFQTNTAGAAMLYRTVQRYVSGALGGSAFSGADLSLQGFSGQPVTGTIYDLYCGTGTITQLLSPVAENVVGVELIPEAVEAAKKSAEVNHITNCTFLAGDVLKVLDEMPEPPDLIVLDPPRAGVSPKALAKILSYGIDSFIYVSCKPESLARDLPYFRAKNYAVRRLVCIDQFPFTAHVETVVWLQDYTACSN